MVASAGRPQEQQALLADGLVGAAVALVEAGYHVLLVGSDAKAPLVAPGQTRGWKDATNDAGELHRRFERYGTRARGIAILVGGPGHPVVVDADGPCAVRAVTTLLSDTIESIPRERTRKGLHLFFAPDPRVRRAVRGVPLVCSCATRRCGIDVLGSTSDGEVSGYVAVAPSVGKAWLGPTQRLGPPGTLPRLPKAFTIAPRHATPAHRSSRRVRLAPEALASARSRFRSVLSEALRIVASAAPGTRHDTLVREAARVGSAAGGAELGIDDAVVKDAARRLIEASIASGHDARDAERSVRDQLAWGATRPAAPAVERSRDDVVDETVRALTTTVRSNRRPGPVDCSTAEAIVERAVMSDEPGLLRVTTGVGKTMYLRRRLVSETTRPILALAPTERLRDELAAGDANGAPPPARHVGRRAPDVATRAELARWEAAGRDACAFPTPAGVCWQMDTVASVAAANHAPMATLCAHCPNGESWAANRILAGRRAHVGRVRDSEEVVERSPELIDVAPCGYLAALEEASSNPALVACHAAYSRSLATQTRRDGPPSIGELLDGDPGPQRAARHVAIDEVPPLIRALPVGLADLASWEARLDSRVRACPSQEARDLASRFSRLLGELRCAIWQESEARLAVAESIIGELYELAVRLGRALEQRSVAHEAPWETVSMRVERRRIDEVFAPLRALRALRLACALGCLEVEDVPEGDGLRRSLIGFEPSALGERLWTTRLSELLGRAARPLPSTPIRIQSATPPLWLERYGEHVGLPLIDATVSQPVTVVATFAAGWGRGRRGPGPNDEAARRQQHAVGLIPKIIDAVVRHAVVPRRSIAVLTHKPWAEALVRAGVVDEDRVLWWGNVEGYNHLRDCSTLVVFGPPVAPSWALRRAYREARAAALLSGAPSSEWPAWSDTSELRPRVVVGGSEVVWPGTLPADPCIRTWFLRHVGDQFVQAIGRLRAVRRNETTVLIFGPCPDLAYAGIAVTPVSAGLAPAPAARERGAIFRAQAEARVAAALQAGAYSFRSVHAWLVAATGRGVHPRVYTRVLRRIEAGETPAQILAAAGLAIGQGVAGQVVHTVRNDLPRSANTAIAKAMRGLRSATRLRPSEHDVASRVRQSRDGVRGADRSPPRRRSS